MPSRAIVSDDLAALVALNDGAVPNVNGLPPDALAAIVAQAAFARVIGAPDAVAFLVALRPGAAYDSPNYRWFCARYDDFLYVDRIVVASAQRSAGLGAALYRELASYARTEGVARVTCEVNLEPPNPASLRFHQRLGFAEVGRQHPDGGAKLVSLLCLDVTG